MIMVHDRAIADDEGGHDISEQAICKGGIALPPFPSALACNSRPNSENFVSVRWLLTRWNFSGSLDVQRGSNMKGSDLLVAALENEGVDRIFGVPGEENLDVVESLRRSSIELVATRHEQSAAFMAATYGRLTGRPGVALSTLGPGALNLATGAAYSYLGGMPLVLITGQKPIHTSRQAQFQIVDVIASMKPLTKHTRQIIS